MDDDDIIPFKPFKIEYKKHTNFADNNIPPTKEENPNTFTIHKTLDSYLESKNIVNIKIELPDSNNLDEINDINMRNKKNLKKAIEYYNLGPCLVKKSLSNSVEGGKDKFD